MVVRLPPRASEGTGFRTSNAVRGERELGPALPCRPCRNLAHTEGLHAAHAVRRRQRQPRGMMVGAKHEVLLDAPLTEELPAAVQRGRSATLASPYRAHTVVGYTALNQVLVKIMPEAQGVDCDACEAFGEPSPSDADLV